MTPRVIAGTGVIIDVTRPMIYRDNAPTGRFHVGTIIATVPRAANLWDWWETRVIILRATKNGRVSAHVQYYGYLSLSTWKVGLR